MCSFNLSSCFYFLRTSILTHCLSIFNSFNRSYFFFHFKPDFSLFHEYWKTRNNYSNYYYSNHCSAFTSPFVIPAYGISGAATIMSLGMILVSFVLVLFFLKKTNLNFKNDMSPKKKIS